MGGYHFDKKLILGTGELSSSSTLVSNTNHSTHCMTMLTNGNVGIGTTNPSYRQLLQKIEELTLYLIQQEQTILELRQEVEQLKK